MTQHLNRINLGLLLLIGGLCIFQWQGEKEARLKINDLQRSTAENTHRIAQQEESLRGANEDLDRFRVQVTDLKNKTDEQNAQIREERAQNLRLDEAKKALTKQSEALKKGLEDYKAALGARDENIKTLLEQRDQLYAANKDAVGKANLAIATYNDVNNRYSELVGKYNELAAKYQAQNAAPATQETATK